MAEFDSLALRVAVPRRKMRGIPVDEREEVLQDYVEGLMASNLEKGGGRVNAEEDRESPKSIHYILRIQDISVAERETARKLIEDAGFRIAEELEDEEGDDEDDDAPWRASLEPDDHPKPDDGDRLAGV